MPVIELGRIGRDVELRYTPSGDAVCNIALAVDYGRKGQDGKRPTQWYEVSLWGKRAEALQPYLLKGGMIRNATNAPSVDPTILEQIQPYNDQLTCC